MGSGFLSTAFGEDGSFFLDLLFGFPSSILAPSRVIGVSLEALGSMAVFSGYVDVHFKSGVGYWINPTAHFLVALVLADPPLYLPLVDVSFRFRILCTTHLYIHRGSSIRISF